MQNQLFFLKQALNNRIEVRQYSGRCMYGDSCPAIYSDYADIDDFFKIKNISRDSMGMGQVYYVRS